MQALEQFRNRIKTVGDIKTVVATMKTLAAARIRQFESVANATNSFDQAIELAIQLLLQHPDCPSQILVESELAQSTGYVLLGTDQGFCGKFNDHIVAQAVDLCGRTTEETRLISVGRKLGPLLKSRNLNASRSFSLPTSAGGLSTLVHHILQSIADWRDENVDAIQLIYHQRRESGVPVIVQRQLLPFSTEYLNSLARRGWNSRSLPSCAVPWRSAFSGVFQNWLYIQVYRSVAESMASENTSRITAMQKAETNIDSRLDELNLEFKQLRQQLITEELRDVLAGFETA